MYGNQPDEWRDSLTGFDRLRFITNACTRMRFCHADGRLDFSETGPPGAQDPSLKPWFSLRDGNADGVGIVFGHWATLQLGNPLPRSLHVRHVDTGCVWGGSLTALRLEDDRGVQGGLQGRRPACPPMSRPSIAIVVAMAENRVIGRDGDLPWRLPADMARFRTLTMGKPIIMGRRTHESIGRVLGGRHNIVVSRRPDFRAPDCTVAPSLEAALESASGATEVSVIGGASIYARALPLAARIHLTLVHASIDGDVRFPGLEPGEWREVSRTERGADARNRYDLSFVELSRSPPGSACVQGTDTETALAE